MLPSISDHNPAEIELLPELFATIHYATCDELAAAEIAADADLAAIARRADILEAAGLAVPACTGGGPERRAARMKMIMEGLAETKITGWRTSAGGNASPTPDWRVVLSHPRAARRFLDAVLGNIEAMGEAKDRIRERFKWIGQGGLKMCEGCQAVGDPCSRGLPDDGQLCPLWKTLPKCMEEAAAIAAVSDGGGTLEGAARIVEARGQASAAVLELAQAAIGGMKAGIQIRDGGSE